MTEPDFYIAGQAGWIQIIIIVLAVLWLLGYLKANSAKKYNNPDAKTTINNVTIINTQAKEEKKQENKLDDGEYTDYEELK